MYCPVSQDLFLLRRIPENTAKHEEYEYSYDIIANVFASKTSKAIQQTL